MQSLAGVLPVAEINGKSIRSEIPPAAAPFLHKQQMLIAGSRDMSGNVWASLLTGKEGFIQVVDPQTVKIACAPIEGDPLWANLQACGEIGLLAIELVKRRRMRMNGYASVGEDSSISVQMEQVYYNCPKYIQAREIDPLLEMRASSQVTRTDSLSESQRQWISQADTFFIATASKDGKMDASHRGGLPGFIQFRGNSLWFPDYFGNSMFNTLGNIYENPAVGLLFLDFATGNTLQITGSAKIIWDEEEASQFPGAERLVTIDPLECIEIVNEHPSLWKFAGYSPFNPK